MPGQPSGCHGPIRPSHNPVSRSITENIATPVRLQAPAIDIIARHYGQKPILDTSIDFFEDNEMWKVTEADFWLRAVAKHPQDLYSGHHWLFWQYTSTGLLPGIKGRVDINVYEGSSATWARWLASRAP